MKQESINLTFSCQEDLESMSCTNNGKFCSSCQKEVINFTKMSFSEIQQIRGEQTEMCGMFLPEQIDPSLHPIELPKVRSWAFLSTILLSLNFGTATAQSTVDPKVEQSQGTSNAPNLTPAEAKKKAQNGQHISMSKAETTVVAKSEPERKMTQKEIKKRLRKYRKRVFWSKRFPFIHIKRRYRTGKF